MTDVHVVCQKITINGRKMAKLKGSIFFIESEYIKETWLCDQNLKCTN